LRHWMGSFRWSDFKKSRNDKVKANVTQGENVKSG
jgi:hypothetical protein